APEQVDPASGASGLLAPELRPAGLSASSAVLGHAAAERMLRALGRDPSAGDPARTAAVLGSVRLPGRLSHHRIGTARLIVDSAIDRTGVRTALAHAREHWPRIDHVLLCLPDHKDVPGAIAELAGLPVTAADLPLAHLRFARELPPHWHRVHSTDLTPASVAALGDHVLALGTVYFAARLLALADAGTELMSAAGARWAGRDAAAPRPGSPGRGAVRSALPGSARGGAACLSTSVVQYLGWFCGLNSSKRTFSAPL